MEYLIHHEDSCKYLYRSKRFSGRCRRNHEWVFFSEHSVVVYVEMKLFCFQCIYIYSFGSVLSSLVVRGLLYLKATDFSVVAFYQTYQTMQWACWWVVCWIVCFEQLCVCGVCAEEAWVQLFYGQVLSVALNVEVFVAHFVFFCCLIVHAKVLWVVWSS